MIGRPAIEQVDISLIHIACSNIEVKALILIAIRHGQQVVVPENWPIVPITANRVNLSFFQRVFLIKSQRKKEAFSTGVHHHFPGIWGGYPINHRVPPDDFVKIGLHHYNGMTLFITFLVERTGRKTVG